MVYNELKMSERIEMMKRITFNTDSQFAANRGQLIDFVRRSKPDFFFVMNDFPEFKLATEINQASPSTKIIHRHFLVHEGNLSNVPQGDGTLLTEQEFLDFLKADHRPFIIHNVMNEPAPYSDYASEPQKSEGFQKLKILLKWLVNLMELAAKENIGLVVGNFQTVAYSKETIESGVFDEYLTTLHKHRNLHYAGWHEYYFGIIPNGSMGRDDKNLITKEACKIENYPTAQEFLNNPYKHAHIGRYLPFVERAKKIGVFPFNSIFTEYGWDRTLDRTGEITRTVDNINGQQTLGLPTLRNLFNYHYPQISFDEAAFKQIEWADNVYDDSVKAICLFTWSKQQEWLQFDFSYFDDLINRIIFRNNANLNPPKIEYSQPNNNPPVVTPPVSTPPVQTPPEQDTTWVIVSATIETTATLLNVRSAASTLGTVVDKLPKGTQANLVFNAGAADAEIQKLGKANQWIKISYNGKVGYISSYYAKLSGINKVDDWRRGLTATSLAVESDFVNTRKIRVEKISDYENLLRELIALLDKTK